jgi:hypothetical protein
MFELSGRQLVGGGELWREKRIGFGGCHGKPGLEKQWADPQSAVIHHEDEKLLRKSARKASGPELTNQRRPHGQSAVTGRETLWPGSRGQKMDPATKSDPN